MHAEPLTRPAYLNRTQAAELLGVSQATFGRYLASDNPPPAVLMAGAGHRRYERTELLRWAASQTVAK